MESLFVCTYYVLLCLFVQRLLRIKIDLAHLHYAYDMRISAHDNALNLNLKFYFCTK